MSMQMTPHYWQLFASQQAGLLFLPPLTGTRLGLMSGDITDAAVMHDTESYQKQCCSC